MFENLGLARGRRIAPNLDHPGNCLAGAFTDQSAPRPKSFGPFEYLVLVPAGEDADLVLPPYNFIRIHKSLKVTPAMAAGITDQLLEMENIVKLIDKAAPKPGRPKTYKKKKAGNSN